MVTTRPDTLSGYVIKLPLDGYVRYNDDGLTYKVVKDARQATRYSMSTAAMEARPTSVTGVKTGLVVLLRSCF